jgi:hypothetical protein
MDGGHRDGKELGRSCDVYKHGDMIARHPYGSFEVQYFQEVDRVINRPLRASQGSWVMEVDLSRGSDMLDLLKLLNDDEASRMHSVVRMEDVGGDLDRWCIVMTQKGALQNSMRGEGGNQIRERHVMSPTRRLRFNGRTRLHNPLTVDDGNLRAFDGEIPKKTFQPKKTVSVEKHRPQSITYPESVLESMRNPYPEQLPMAVKTLVGHRSLLVSPATRNTERSAQEHSLKAGSIIPVVLGENEVGTTREMESLSNDQRK